MCVRILDVKPISAFPLLKVATQVPSLSFPKHAKWMRLTVSCLGVIVPAWLEEGCAFLQPLALFTQLILFCIRPTTINSLQPQHPFLCSAQGFVELKEWAVLAH